MELPFKRMLGRMNLLDPSSSEEVVVFSIDDVLK